MDTDKTNLLAELRANLTSLELAALKHDMGRVRLIVGRIVSWGREVLQITPPLEVREHRSEVPELRQKLRNLKENFDSTVSAYKDLLDTFDRFRTTIETVHQIKHFEELPQALEVIRKQDELHSLYLTLDADTFAGHIPEGVGSTPGQLLRDRLCQFTPSLNFPRLYLGSVLDVENAAFFLGRQQDPVQGSCFLFALGHKYQRGKIIGVVAGYDPDPKRYSPDMATDFLSHFCDILAFTLIMALEHAQLEEMTVRDALTGVNNRTYLERHAPRILDFAMRKSFPVHLLFIDLNGFKAVNDSLGHEAGDQILINVARSIRAMVRKYDIFVRLGGDEFVVVLPDTDTEMAAAFRERLHVTLENINVCGVCGQESELRVSASVGMASYQPGQNLEDLIREADKLMYAAKPPRNGSHPIHA